MAGFFPVFFKQYWNIGTEVTVSTFQLGVANSLASLTIGLLAPVLGAIADRGGTKKKFLLFFASFGMVMTGSLSLVAQGDWKLAAGLYVLATVGFLGGNIFYDSLIVNVSTEKKMDFISALGYSLGYLGGGLLFAVNVAMTLTPKTFGLNNPVEAIRLSFLSVALWWMVFSLPIFLFVKEPQRSNHLMGRNVVFAGFRQLSSTFHDIHKLRIVFLFLLGYLLYIDGVHTIIRMALDYGMSLGFDSNSLIVALLITQFVGFPAALVFGKIGEKWGTKTGIFIGIGVYILATLWGFVMQREIDFFVLAVAIGLVQGGVQSLSRSFFTRIIPKSKAAEFFGFYNMLGKFAAVIGPMLMGWISMATGNPRCSILGVSLLFIGGAAILYRVNETEGNLMAKTLEEL